MNLPFRSTSLMTTLALGAGALAYLYGVYFPTQQSIDALQQQTIEKQDYALRTERLVAAGAAAEIELAQASRYVDATNQFVPNEAEFPALLFVLNEEAQAAGVTITRVDPQERQQLEQLALAPMEIACQGEFRQLHDFFARLERRAIVLWTDSLVLQPAAPQSPILQCEWKAVAFLSSSPFAPRKDLLSQSARQP